MISSRFIRNNFLSSILAFCLSLDKFICLKATSILSPKRRIKKMAHKIMSLWKCMLFLLFFSSDDSSKSSESFLAGASDRSDPFLPEPRKSPDFPFDCQRSRDLGPIVSGCNLPGVTNLSTVQHFKLEQHLWDSLKWIKFVNGKRNCFSHNAYFGPIIGKGRYLGEYT